MQIYKKEFKPYLFFGIFLGLLGFVVGNGLNLLPGEDLGAKEMSILNGELTGVWIHEHLLQFFFSISLPGLVLMMLGFLLGLLGYAVGNDRGVYRQGQEFGSAKMAKIKNFLKYRAEQFNDNMILTKNVWVSLFNKLLPVSLQKNKSVLVLGDSGAGKTLSYIKTNIMQMHSSFIVTDPDMGLVHEVGKMLIDAGYKIKILDLDGLINSDQFNVFEYIKTELDIDRVLEEITEGTKKGENNGEDFWIRAEALLVRALIAYLWFDGKDNNYIPHLGMISDMLRMIKRRDPKVPSPVEEWFEEQNQKRPDNYAYRQWSLFNDLYEAETRASVLGIAAARYSVFDHDQVRDMVRRDTMEIEKWNEEKTAVFIGIPETNDAYNFIASTFLATVMETLRHKSDLVRKGLKKLAPGRSLLHIRFLIDEFANIGRIPNFEKALATFRKREMSFSIILQSLDQLKTMYKHGWKSIVNNCAAVLYLGGEEEDTTKDLSRRAGKQTIAIRDPNNQKGQKVSRGRMMGRDLFTPDEIALLKGDEALLFISKERVVKDKKFFAFEHPRANELSNGPDDDNWYTYKRFMNDVEELLDKVNPKDIVDLGTVEGGEAA